MDWHGKKVALIGLGRSNAAVARYLLAGGVRVTACDRKNAAELGHYYNELAARGAEFQLGPNYLEKLERFDILVVSPGVKPSLPELQRAKAYGVKLTNEIGIFLNRCRAPVIGITGTSGKTTTATMIAEILSAAGYRLFLGGNMGKPLIDQVNKITPESWVVLELSSFQLDLLERSPQIALITNISPDHLDFHASMAEYIAAKKHIFKYQNGHNWTVLNADNPITRKMAGEVPGRLSLFSVKKMVERGACLESERIMSCRAGLLMEIAKVSEIKLIGRHNIENVLAAVAVADIVGCSAGAMHDVVTSFTGVAHRLELVREAGGIAYYNDSVATTPVEAAAGMRAFGRPVILIAGGVDKNLPWDEFVKAVADTAKAVVLIGKAKESIAAALAEGGVSHIPVKFAGSLEEAVETAKNMAQAGDIVLLSPACASFDMFANFEERGQRFREIIYKLTEEAPLSGIKYDS